MNGLSRREFIGLGAAGAATLAFKGPFAFAAASEMSHRERIERALAFKETDRLAALRRELTKLGATVDEFADGLAITPPARLIAASIDTYNDHRMAMSFALAGLKCEGMVIKDPICTAKTFPEFFQFFEGMRTSNS